MSTFLAGLSVGYLLCMFVVLGCGWHPSLNRSAE